MNLTDESGDPSAEIEAMADTVAVLESGGTISTGLAASLSAKLDAATNRLDDQARAAVGILTAFVQQVTALVRAEGLNSADGEILITAADNVIARISPD